MSLTYYEGVPWDEVDPYGTHMPVLDQIVPAECHAVEFGCGFYSTPFLVARCASLLSIENSSLDWPAKVQHEIGEPEHWTLTAMRGPWQFLRTPLPDNLDFGFVDSHETSRWGIVNYLMRLGVPIIAAHDTENDRAYKYRWVTAEGYRRIDFKERTPWTSVWLHDSVERQSYEP